MSGEIDGYNGDQVASGTSEREGTPEVTHESLVVAFDWLLGAEMDDNERGIEIGNIYAYALAEGVSLEKIEELYEQALEEESNG